MNRKGGVEQVGGIHGYLDLMGVYMAWQYGLVPDVLTLDFLQRMAHTMNSSWYRAQFGRFAGLVNGYSSACGPLRGPD